MVSREPVSPLPSSRFPSFLPPRPRPVFLRRSQPVERASLRGLQTIREILPDKGRQTRTSRDNDDRGGYRERPAGFLWRGRASNPRATVSRCEDSRDTPSGPFTAVRHGGPMGSFMARRGGSSRRGIRPIFGPIYDGFQTDSLTLTATVAGASKSAGDDCNS